jgi:2-phospho-L-lactate guanylyltransferase
MTTWAIVPVKGAGRSKSRLAPTLSPVERQALSAALLERVLHACDACAMIDHVLVASDNPRLIAPSARMSLLLDAVPHPPFAAVLDAALAHAHAHGATRAAIVLGDLPLIGPRDVAELVGNLVRAQLVVAPDRSRRGVGAVACTLPAPMPMQLGHRDSFARTMRVASARELKTVLVHNPRIAHDLDTSADLESLGLSKPAFRSFVGV